ncbi:MAG: hypothetical protein R3212_02480, partial [Xanthomonadales bacterium]|nr:hypothetical protein [Xanthomonadales bacterium]
MSPEHQQTQGRTLSFPARIGIGALIALAAVTVLILIFSTEPVAERETAVRQNAMLVQVTRPEAGSFRPVIETTGIVQPAREITLTPRVSGEIVGRSESFIPGGFVRQGEVVVRIDDADYLNLLRQRESETKQAVAELEIEEGRRELAERDYRELQGRISDDNRALILRQPQQRAAE